MKETGLNRCLIFAHIFSKQHCGFRKGFNMQQCLLMLLEKSKNKVDKAKILGALLTDLSKAFNCLNHELLIVKLSRYGFTLPAFKLIYNYLSYRKMGTSKLIK